MNVYLFKIFIFLIVISVPLPSQGQTSQPPSTTNNTGVAYACGDLMVRLPDDLEDRSVYTFEDGPEKIDVGYEVFSKTITSADVIKDLQKKMTTFLGTRAAYTVYDLKAGVVESTVLVLDIGGKQFIYTAAFRWADKFMATIRVQTTRGDAKAFFEHIVKSVSTMGQQPASGYKTGLAGLLYLDIPSSFTLPTLYRFVSEDDQIQLTISKEKPDEEQWATWESGDKGAKIKLNIAKPASNKAIVKEEHFQINRGAKTPGQPASKWFRYAQISTHDGTPVYLTLQDNTASGFDERWTAILNSVRLSAR